MHADLAERYRRQGLEVVERPVAVTTLDRLCERHVDRTIDFLKVDAEGFERQVFTGFDLLWWRPRVILVEAPWPELWDEGLVVRADYLPAGFDGLNRYYVRAEEPSLVEAFQTPVNVTDNFIPHEYVRLLDQYAGGPRLGATTLALARRAQRLATRRLRGRPGEASGPGEPASGLRRSGFARAAFALQPLGLDDQNMTVRDGKGQVVGRQRGAWRLPGVQSSADPEPAAKPFHFDAGSGQNPRNALPLAVEGLKPDPMARLSGEPLP